jgi:hypothetical protein
MKKLGTTAVVLLLALAACGAGGVPAKQHRWTDKDERKFVTFSRRAHIRAVHCTLGVFERHYPSYARFYAVFSSGVSDADWAEFQLVSAEARQVCHVWTAAEEDEFLVGTPHDSRSRCILHATEKAFPTYDAWHTASEESTPDGDYTPAFSAFLDKTERECKHA